ncbi:MAG: IS66 family insertion sequence element accessory protein TnpB [Gaiellaceae bacterium]
MIGSTRAVRVFARATPTDLRKGFNGLYGLVERELGQDPLSGDAFLFVNRTRTSAKVLLFDGTGLCIYAKRLARGRFASLWREDGASTLALSMTELALFLEGADLSGRLPLTPEKVSMNGTDSG